jgi:hypothetical protein
VPAVSPVTVVIDPLPTMFPGLIVQVPEGSPPKTTLPVLTEQVGCVIVPTLGAAGVTAVIVIDDVAPDVHPTELVTVNE